MPETNGDSASGEDLVVLIVADDPLARTGLAVLMQGQPGIGQVVQMSSDELPPVGPGTVPLDVILWDAGWETSGGGSSWLERMGQWNELSVPIVVLVSDSSQAAEAWAAGARGILSRQTRPSQLSAAVSAVVQGVIVLDPGLAAMLVPSVPPSARATSEDLTARETEVLQLIAEGLANKAIAQRLGVTDHTVKFHVNAILGKLQAQSRTEAVVRASQRGLIIL